MTVGNHPAQFDCILVGGGLQSGLIALALKHHHPNARVLMIERDKRIAGNHTWSFHYEDIPESCYQWMELLLQYLWSGYQVKVGNLRRRVDLAYASVSSEHFAEVIEKLFMGSSKLPGRMDRARALATVGSDSASFARLPETKIHLPTEDDPEPAWQLMTRTEVTQISERSVTTRCGKTFLADLVVDCRGPSASQRFAGCGYQKFYGFELELTQDWPEQLPVIMSGVEDQRDGFRFLYTLPLSRRRVLVEDTRFADMPDIDRDDCLQVVNDHLSDIGVADFQIIREESGVLPMPFSSELLPSSPSPLAGGYAGGWFHAATGYSVPMAVALAQAISSGPLLSARERIQALSEQHRWRSRYSRFLNRLLFRLVSPSKRYRIFERFYRVLDDSAVGRFYSHRFRVKDAFRIVVGIPPTLIGLRPLRFVRSFFPGVSS